MWKNSSSKRTFKSQYDLPFVLFDLGDYKGTYYTIKNVLEVLNGTSSMKFKDLKPGDILLISPVIYKQITSLIGLSALWLEKIDEAKQCLEQINKVEKETDCLSSSPDAPENQMKNLIIKGIECTLPNKNQKHQRDLKIEKIKHEICNLIEDFISINESCLVNEDRVTLINLSAILHNVSHLMRVYLFSYQNTNKTYSQFRAFIKHAQSRLSTEGARFLMAHENSSLSKLIRFNLFNTLIFTLNIAITRFYLSLAALDPTKQTRFTNLALDEIYAEYFLLADNKERKPSLLAKEPDAFKLLFNEVFKAIQQEQEANVIESYKPFNFYPWLMLGIEMVRAAFSKNWYELTEELSVQLNNFLRGESILLHSLAKESRLKIEQKINEEKEYLLAQDELNAWDTKSKKKKKSKKKRASKKEMPPLDTTEKNLEEALEQNLPPPEELLPLKSPSNSTFNFFQPVSPPEQRAVVFNIPKKITLPLFLLTEMQTLEHILQKKIFIVGSYAEKIMQAALLRQVIPDAPDLKCDVDIVVLGAFEKNLKTQIKTQLTEFYPRIHCVTHDSLDLKLYQLNIQHWHFDIFISDTKGGLSEIEDFILKDATCRDFTKSSIFISSEGNIYDPLKGIEDSLQNTLRTARNPFDVLREDPVRALRALAKVAKDQTQIEPSLDIALKQFNVKKEIINTLAYQTRMGQMTRKILHKMAQIGKKEIFIDLMQDYGLARLYVRNDNALLPDWITHFAAANTSNNDGHPIFCPPYMNHSR